MTPIPALDISNEVIPDSLGYIAVAYICNNLTTTICTENEANGLKIREGIHLPQAVSDKIMQYLVDSLNLDPLQKEHVSEELVMYCKMFTDGKKCKLRRIIINRAPISDDMVQVLVELCEAHNLLEIDLSNSSDMNGDDDDLTPPFNHAILLPEFILRDCGKTLQKLIMNHTCLIHSINQIMMFSGKKATVLKQNVYLASNARIENLPICLSGENVPNLSTLDLSESFIGWFLTIDPTNPPPLKVLNVGGYHEIHINSTMKKVLKQLVYGEEDHDLVPERRSVTLAHSQSERKLQQYKFFEKIQLPERQKMLDRFLEASALEKSLVEESKTANDYRVIPKNNFVLRQMNVLALKNTLRHLGLYNSWLTLSDFEDVIFLLKNLQHLDVAWPVNKISKSTAYRPAAITIWQILDNLPALRSLDVSGTFYGEKLYDEAKVIEGETERTLKMDRKCKPLDFLGLWATKSCRLKGMEKLALRISGDSNEEQLLTCLEMYQDRLEIISDVLTKLSNILQDDSCNRPNLCLKLLLRCIYRYPTSGDLLFVCAANIYYLVQLQFFIPTIYQKRDIVRAVTTMLERNLTNQVLVRNCMVIYFNLDLPRDLLFDFIHIAQLVLNIFDKQRDVAEVNIIAGNLCNALVCSMEVDVKTQIRKLNYVSVMIDVIKSRLETGNGDDVLETAWSALWNVTDETVANSDDFIAMDGLDLFCQCYKKFPGRHDLVRNMMGLIGNIAEVEHLRPHLAENDILKLIIRLVHSPDSGDEVAYNACGTLSNILIDNSEILKETDVTHIRNEMWAAILSWDGDVARNVNYRNFTPLFAVLRCPREPVTHLWAMWAIHNLCMREPNYVQLVIKGGGVGLIKSIRDTTKYEKIRHFAEEVAKKCDCKEGTSV